MAQKITNKTTDLQIGTVLKVINIKENTPFKLNKFYNITDGDGVGALFVGGYSDVELTMHELGDYFEHIATIEDIEDLDKKVLLIKQIFKQFKELSDDANEQISTQALINETIAFLAQDEIYQADEVELRFICKNIDITMVEQCSCCGKTLMPDDECYEDDLNDGAALCDHCSIFDEETDMYIKTVHQDVIEEITGYKFSPHLGNVGSTVEEFNYWLNSNKLPFSHSEKTSTENFMTFINECTEFSTCDSCKLIEKSSELKWVTSGDFVNDENVAVKFALATLNVDALCQVCIDAIINRTKLNLHEIVQRIKENKMVYRVGDLVVLENVNFDEKKISNKTYIDYIVSIDENKQTYKLKEYGDVEFTEDDFFDIANEAYVSEYTKFIASQHPDLSEDVDQWSITIDEGFPEIKKAFEEFGFKDEFIEHLKSNDLAYERFATGNKVTIDELDETLIVKNELLEYIFCQEDDNNKVVPTYKELTEVNDYKSNWKLTEEYGDYSLSTLIYLVDEQSSRFFSIQKVLNGHKEKFRKSKKNGLRTYAEYGAPIEVILELQELYNIYGNGIKNPELELLLLQDSRNTQDFSSIEILVQDEIKYDELSLHLKSKLDTEHHDEVDNLLEAIKEAKADKHEVLHVYDC